MNWLKRLDSKTLTLRPTQRRTTLQQITFKSLPNTLTEVGDVVYFTSERETGGERMECRVLKIEPIFVWFWKKKYGS